MGEFVYFTEEQKQRANAVDLEDFLSRQGEKLLRSCLLYTSDAADE